MGLFGYEPPNSVCLGESLLFYWPLMLARPLARALLPVRAFSGKARPFRVLGIQQIAIGALDK